MDFFSRPHVPDEVSSGSCGSRCLFCSTTGANFRPSLLKMSTYILSLLFVTTPFSGARLQINRHRIAFLLHSLRNFLKPLQKYGPRRFFRQSRKHSSPFLDAVSFRRLPQHLYLRPRSGLSSYRPADLGSPSICAYCPTFRWYRNFHTITLA